MGESSRKRALEWPFPRCLRFDEQLRKAACDWFELKKVAVDSKCRYCLPDRSRWTENIILPEVVEYILGEQSMRASRSPFPLHKYVHHGLSSQAFLFNLLGPLVVRDDTALLSGLLAEIGVAGPQGPAEPEFEMEDRSVFNEDQGQPTSIDFALQGSSGSVFIEGKLTEKGFGGCSVFEKGDCSGQNPVGHFESCYLHHIGRTYWQKMEEQGFLSSALVSGEICPFAGYYQFFREVLFALDQGGSFVLLCDARNQAFLRNIDAPGPPFGLWSLLKKSVPAEHADRVGVLTAQQVVSAVEASGNHGDWIGEFKSKYALN